MTLTFHIGTLHYHSTGQPPGKTEFDLIDLVNVDSEFHFFINGQLVLKDEHWNIGELAYQLIAWEKSGFKSDFRYSSIDATETDLFSFTKDTEGFFFYSRWAETIVSDIIDKTTLGEFIAHYTTAVKQEMMTQLNFDAGRYLA